MDRKYIDDHHIVARYLADQLPDAEREAFEACYLDHPEIVRDLEAAARFKVGLAQLRDSGELDGLLQPQPWFRQQRYLAIAAGIAIVSLGALFWTTSRREPPDPWLVASATALVDRSGGPLPIVATYPIMRTRSSSYDADIELPPSEQAIALRVLPEVEAVPPRYRISIYSIADDDSLHEAGVIGNLTPDSEGFVPVYFNTARIARGRYQLTLAGDTGTSAENESSTFRIRIIDDAS